ncbi:MAG: hypothetical protein ACW99R_17465, partial [Candidatus Hodarchaeales archaeon]
NYEEESFTTEIPRLTSSALNNSLTEPERSSELVPSLDLSTTSLIEDNNISNPKLNTPPERVFIPRFGIAALYDVSIISISPEAMEKNATSMIFTMKLSIEGGIGLDIDVVENLTLDTGIDILITNASYLEWINENSSNEEYALVFELNNSILSGVDFGIHQLIFYTNVVGTYSSDSIPLPMRDVWVGLSIDPTEFNNALDEVQFFTVEIEVRNYTSSSSFTTVKFLPEILDNGTAINPRAFIKSGPDIGFLQFEGFISNNTSQGRFNLKYSLSVSISQDFEDGDYELQVSVTTTEFITGNVSTQFIAKGTRYLVDLEEITVESYSSLNHDDLLASSQNGVKLRLNVNDSVTFTFHVIDADLGVNVPRVHSIRYQDPNEPEDPTALLDYGTDANGFGNISLSATDLTPDSGYSLLLYVRGHRTTQESDSPSNITIYWDILFFNYTFSDLIDEGSSSSPNQKALGLDVNETWMFNLGLFYASDGTAAVGGNISFRFGGGIWTNLVDGINDNPIIEDGRFSIAYTYDSPSELLFECQITSGAKIDPQKTLFVTKTDITPFIDLKVTWTYLIVDMSCSDPDARLSTLTPTNIDLNVTWAHNASFFAPLDDLFLVVHDNFWKTSRPIQIDSGFGSYTGLVNIYDGKYRYRIVSILDEVFGITKFTNSSFLEIENPQVQLDIIWESVLFSYSHIYNSSLPPENQSWGITSFFANFGENASLYIYGRHSFDDSPFNGIAVLWAFEIAESYTVHFVNGVGIWSADLTLEGFEISFSIMEILEDQDFGIESVGTYDSVIISWDKIVLTLEANLTVSHGSWTEISVKYQYLIRDYLWVDPQYVTYTLLLSNGTIREHVSWTSFKDFSLYPAAHSYLISEIFYFDLLTNLSNALVQYKWTDIEMDPVEDELVVYWIDDEAPIIVELQSYDLGNGTIIIVVDVADENEYWVGSGVSSVVLHDNRPGVDYEFPLQPTPISLGQGLYRYYFTYSYNQLIPGQVVSDDYFQFEFEEPLNFTLIITDNGTNEFPDIVGEDRNAKILTTEPFTITTSFDPFQPEFISIDGSEIAYIFPEIEEILQDKPSITDGEIIISVDIQDNVWSGIDIENILLLITKIETNKTKTYFMDMNNPTLSLREVISFSWSGSLDVGVNYRITVIIRDKAGNTNTSTIEITVEDHVAPRIESIVIESNPDRVFKISVALNETGFGVDLVQVVILDGTKVVKWVNLTKQGGSGITADDTLDIYYGEVSIPFDVFDFITISPNIYSIEVFVKDRANNPKHYRSGELEILQVTFEGKLNPVLFHPFVLLTGLILLISSILVGIRITSRTEGYDMNKIFSEGEKIPREVILTQMDEYALGVTINFFDQVQGPVPVIWEPALLEDQQQVMLDLSDKSFSTLEFIGLEETERSGTFDFSTGSYECTALGYSFAIDNPQARGGKENLTVVLLLRKEWGDNLLIFQDELTEKLREIREMIETQKEPILIEKKARELREYVSRIMLSFNKIYAGLDYELAQQEE